VFLPVGSKRPCCKLKHTNFRFRNSCCNFVLGHPSVSSSCSFKIVSLAGQTMKVTVTTLSDEIFILDVSEDLELENFKAFCEIEYGIPARELILHHEGRPLLEDTRSLKYYGIKEGDVVLMQHMQSSDHQSTTSSTSLPSIDFGSVRLPGNPSSSSIASNENDPTFIRDMFMANPDQLSLLKQNNPRLADALLSGDISRFARVLQDQQTERADRERMRIRMLNADPFDLEAQRLIAEEIRLRNIETNMEAAMEHNPESFAQVVMLYINCKVNGHPVKAFIDSGAQTTIMSQSCAERCTIMRLVDTRWAGIAKGVGTQKIIGRVHLCQIQIDEVFLTSSFSILEDQPMDMLLGLDMLRRHQCVIDLQRNVLVIGSTGTVTRFLAESELPECARLTYSPDLTPRRHEEEDKQLAQALQRSADEAVSNSNTPSTTNTPNLSIFPTTRFPEADVQKIVNMGFSREEVLNELQRFNGDVTQAMAALFAKSLMFSE
uniref:Ubiquitin-like domain-containing protein n=1 Tax=Strigamia maritima TaxID=126957 RepID=T1ISG3_STRMM